MCFLLYPKDFFSGLATSGRGPLQIVAILELGACSQFRNRYKVLWEGNLPEALYQNITFGFS